MSEGAGEVSGVREAAEELDFVEDLTEDAEQETQADDTGSENETARETVERELSRLQKEASGEGGAPAEKGAAAGSKEKGVKEPVELPPIAPPARMTAADKELFEKLPYELQRSMAKSYQDLQSMATKATMAARAAQKEAAHVVETVRPYLLAHPELQAEGFTESKLVASLLAAHQRLTNPETAIQAYAELGMQLGLDSDKLSDLLGDAGKPRNAASVDISQHPQFVALQNELKRVSSVVGGAQKQYEERAVGEALKEVQALQNEKDQFGRFRYPKLHDAEFLERTKPLVSALAKSLPDLSYGEILRRAHDSLEGSASPAQANQSRLANQRQLAAPQAAGVSVRGKSAPSSAGLMEEIPAEALGDARSSVVWALKQLRRG